MSAKAIVDECTKCGKRELVSPLHGERGGPLFCIPCGMEWHGEYGRRRRWGRIVIKAMKAYAKAGGHLYGDDFDALKLAASGYSLGGYEAEPDTIGAEIGDITSELLRDTLQLVHPDHQPPERRELAQRVTQELTALKPFVFPAPKREVETPAKPEARDESFKSQGGNLKEPLRKLSSYPCEDCAETTYSYYCTACKTEHDKRWNKDLERDRAKQRKWYKQRKLRKKQYTPLPTCAICGAKFEKKRADAECCSAACRQKLYRQRKAGIRDKQPSQKQVARRQERERKARIKLKWDRLGTLDEGSTVIMNGDGHHKFPRGTKFTLGYAVRWWRRDVRLDGPRRTSLYFNRRDVDEYDIVPAAAFSSLTDKTAVDTLRTYDGDGTQTDTSRARVESTKTGRRGGGGPEFDRKARARGARHPGIAGATDPADCRRD
jgi:hypothetical protein